ncbi:M64 family metallopeptidase, partial [Chitinimonas sp.]|uniref:M64 family metallopeptidase n=1 Tax=Chitinimonas sp. TaxID=1934313 RepID=UPI0035B1A2FB
GQLQIASAMRRLDDKPALSLNLSSLPVREQASASPTQLLDTGASANRLDILIMGDGYTASEQAKFQQDAADMAERFLSISPYKDYRNLIKISSLFTASAESGASKPACAETPSEPAVVRNTAFGGHFCTSGIRRLVTVDSSKVLAAAAAAPDWDHIFVLINDTEYGGAGGSLAVATLNKAATQLIQHEFGHSFTRLADEYSSAYPGYPACSDAPGSTRTCEANVTDQTDPAAIKWRRWFSGNPALPSVGELADPRGAGLWLGARYQSSGMYRQCYDGIMRSFTHGWFCHVDAEAFVLRLYQGGWGLPKAGISNIEPGSSSPQAGKTINAGDCQRYQAQLAGPDGSTLAVSWSVDGKLVQSDQLAHGAYAKLDRALGEGSHTITLTVSDRSPVLFDPHQSSSSWNIVAGTASKPQLDRLFDWAEQQFPSLFAPARQQTEVRAGLTQRYYPGSDATLAVNDCKVFYTGPLSGKQQLYVGAVADYMPDAEKAGF